MNVAVKGMAGAVSLVTERMTKADKALDAYLVALGELFAAGGEAAAMSGVPSCLLSPKAQECVANAIGLAAQIQEEHTEAHRALHEDVERLASLDPGTGDPAPRSGGGGDKIPPPK